MRIPDFRRLFPLLLVLTLAMTAGTILAVVPTVGATYPAFRDLLQGRIDAIPAEGAPTEDAREQAALVRAVALLDTESPTLDTDLDFASKVMAILAKLKAKHDSTLLMDENTEVVRRDLCDRILMLEAVPPYVPVFGHPRFERASELARRVANSGFLAPDSDKGCRFLKKALAILRKRDRVAAKERVPAGGDRLRIRLWDNPLTLGSDPPRERDFTVKRAGFAYSFTYDTTSDVATLELHLMRKGVDRHITVHLASPGPGAHTVHDVLGTATIGDVASDSDAWCYFEFWEWDPANHYAFGWFVFEFGPDPYDGRSFYPRGIGVFTSRSMVVVSP